MKIKDICSIRKGQRLIVNNSLIQAIQQGFTIPIYGSSDKILSATNDGYWIQNPKVRILND